MNLSKKQLEELASKIDGHPEQHDLDSLFFEIKHAAGLPEV